MLNKKVCMTCHKSYDHNCKEHGCEKAWEEFGIVYCLWAWSIHTEKEPPKQCAYILEHAVNQKASKC